MAGSEAKIWDMPPVRSLSYNRIQKAEKARAKPIFFAKSAGKIHIRRKDILQEEADKGEKALPEEDNFPRNNAGSLQTTHD